MCFKRQQLAFQLRRLIGVGGSEGRILRSRRVARNAMHARRAAMHDAAQLRLILAGGEQDARPLDVRLAIERRRDAGMIEPPHQVVDDLCTLHRLPDLALIGDPAAYNCERIAELRARLALIACQDADRLLSF